MLDNAWRHLDSSNLSAVRYDSDEEALEVEFHSGARYRYENVPQVTVDALMEANSHGSYFHHNIRSEFEFVKTRQKWDEEEEENDWG